jgi:hypothetical protein
VPAAAWGSTFVVRASSGGVRTRVFVARHDRPRPDPRALSVACLMRERRPRPFRMRAVLARRTRLRTLVHARVSARIALAGRPSQEELPVACLSWMLRC